MEVNEAERLFRRALAINETMLGPDHLETKNTRKNLENALRILGGRNAFLDRNLLQDAQFQELVAVAKRMARFAGKKELTVLLLCYALTLDTSVKLLPALRGKLEALARVERIILTSADHDRTDEKMKIAVELREMIAQHKSSTFAEFVTAILTATVV
jgi:hypothetical protein